MVRRGKRVLGRDSHPLREERRQLSDGLVVADPRRSGRRAGARLPIHPEARRSRLRQHRLRPLGSGHRLVQQHRLERRPVDAHAVLRGDRTLRMEQIVFGQVDRAARSSLVEHREEHAPLRSKSLLTRPTHHSAIVEVRAENVDLSGRTIPAERPVAQTTENRRRTGTLLSELRV